MAFNIGFWGQVNVSTNTGAPSIYNYINLSDTSTQMLTAGYFNSMAATLSVGDSILAVASDLTKLLRVTAVSNTNAQTYSVSVLSDFATDIDGGIEIFVEGTATAADILSMASIPFEIVAAPGEGIYVVPVDIALQYNYGTTPYTITDAPFFTVIWFDGTEGTSATILPIAAIDFIDQTESITAFSQGYATTPVPLSSMLNCSLVLGLAGDVDLTDGDGTITYRLVYRLFF